MNKKQYTINDVAEATLQQVDNFVQQAHDLVEQLQALIECGAGITDDERLITREEAERMGTLEQLQHKYKIDGQLREAISRVKTAGQGRRPEKG